MMTLDPQTIWFLFILMSPVLGDLMTPRYVGKHRA